MLPTVPGVVVREDGCPEVAEIKQWGQGGARALPGLDLISDS